MSRNFSQNPGKSIPLFLIVSQTGSGNKKIKVNIFFEMLACCLVTGCNDFGEAVGVGFCCSMWEVDLFFRFNSENL